MMCDGVVYNNQYCFVIYMQEGKMCELIEYFDIELVNWVFGYLVVVFIVFYG